ncbi:MAG: FAD-linked oxidase C-terminal domain-containing protein [Planctomycetota bacterium]
MTTASPGLAADSSKPFATRDLAEVSRALAGAVSGEVRFGLHDRMLYATDASIYQVEPLGVVIPDSVDDAVRAVAFCAKLGLPVLPRGGGTSLAGQCTSEAVVIDLSARCLGVIETDPVSCTCRVEAGVTVDDLNDRVRSHSLHFAPDPSTSRHATVAGCIGNNAAGSHSVLYGRTSESLLGVDVALADGRRVTFDEGAALRDPLAAEVTKKVCDIVKSNKETIRERFPKTKRRNAGYALDMVLDALEAGDGGLEKVNLAHLICGSEGTLAVTLGAKLKLHPIPVAKGLAVVAFETLDAAIDAVLPMLELKPAAVELLDDLIVGLARENIEYRRYVDLLPEPPSGPAAAVLYCEFFAEHDASELESKFSHLRSIFGSDRVQCHTDRSAMAQAWKLRKAGEPLLHAIPGSRKPLGFVEDNAVPPEKLGEFVPRFREIVEREGTKASYYAHASVGVLHVRPLLSLSSDADRAAMERIAIGAADLAQELGGVMSGEHGDGKARGPLLERFYGPEIMDAFRAVKAIFDSEGRLNPGNVVDPKTIESIHASTRVKPKDSYASIKPVETFYDYSDQTDFAHAVEMCNGAGVCRKKTGGVMCPSFMATMDERHSTRGRGNALRLAISGQVNLVDPGSPAWGDQETEATLDLCLSCKACKSECPSNVDIARLKAEYTAQTYKATGAVPLQSKVFGKIHELSSLAGIAPGLANFGAKAGRGIADALLGLHPDRSLPAFAKPLHKQWGKPEVEFGAPVVLLYADTFTTYNEPEIGLASKRLLEAFGYRVELFRGTDAARAMMSVGMLEDAVVAVDAEIPRLEDAIEASKAEAILFCEPSVMSAVCDDWVSLRTKSSGERKRALVGQSRLVEQFLDERWDGHPRTPDFGRSGAERRGEFASPSLTLRAPSRVAFHGHCHQKALWGAGSSAGLLKRVFGDRVDVLDTTCCGMAGSFGYTRDRYALSMRIGELSVFPAVRELGQGGAIVAPGTSCRHQIKDGTGVRAWHPVEVVTGVLG